MLLQLLWVLAHIGGRKVIGNDALQKVEPEERELRQHSSLSGNPGGEDVIECRDPVRRHQEEMIVTDPVEVADLPAGVEIQVGKISMQDNFVTLRCIGHGCKSIRRVVGYSNFPAWFVNVAPRIPPPARKNSFSKTLDKTQLRAKPALLKAFRALACRLPVPRGDLSGAIDRS